VELARQGTLNATGPGIGRPSILIPSTFLAETARGLAECSSAFDRQPNIQARKFKVWKLAVTDRKK